MFTQLTQPGFLKALYSGNAIWHSSAFLHFCFRQPLMMRKLSKRASDSNQSVARLPQGDAQHHDIMAYLGGINTSMALLALLRLYTTLWRSSSKLVSTDTKRGDIPLDVTAMLVLGLANCSQAVMNFALGQRTQRWIVAKGLERITVLNAVFTVLDWCAAAGLMALVQ